MRLHRTIGFMLVTILFVTYSGLADQTAGENTLQEKKWRGTWIDMNYSLSIEQNNSDISGIGHSFDIGSNDPFLLSGKISDDGKVLNGTRIETGTLIMHLSDDLLSFTGDGTVDPVDSTSERYSYSTRGKRNGTEIIQENLWNGEWITNNSSMTIDQSDISVSGEYHALKYPIIGGVFTGKVSEDGKTLSTNWTSVENSTFILSDDGMNLVESGCSEQKNAVEVCLNLTRSVEN